MKEDTLQRQLDACKPKAEPAKIPAYHLPVPPWREGSPEWVAAQHRADAAKFGK
jgi:hypothetical protein